MPKQLLSECTHKQMEKVEARGNQNDLETNLKHEFFFCSMSHQGIATGR